GGDAAASEAGRAGAVVEPGERKDRRVDAAAEGGPVRSVPARHVVRRDAARRREAPTDVERLAGAGVVGDHRADDARDAGSERAPRAPVPARDPSDRGPPARLAQDAGRVE